MFHKMLHLRKKLMYFLSLLFLIHRNLTLRFTPLPPANPIPSLYPLPPFTPPPPVYPVILVGRGGKKAGGNDGMTSLTPLPRLIYPPPPPGLFPPPPSLLPSPLSLYPPVYTPPPSLPCPFSWGGGFKKLEGRVDAVETWHLVKDRA